MRFLKTIALLGVIAVAIGFWRGWFSVSGHGRDAESNKVNVSLTMDPDKVKEDAGRVKDKTTELGQKTSEKVKSIGK